MIRPFKLKEQITHSHNPYIHKCCACIHLRIGSVISCLIWMGLSLYFAVLSFQGKSRNGAALYIFGTINLILAGIALGSLFPIYLKSVTGLRSASQILWVAIIVYVVDLIINVIVFSVNKTQYIHWCVSSNFVRLDSIFTELQLPIQQTSTNNTTATSPSYNMSKMDFYNCSRTWEDELKFLILTHVVMGCLYAYWALSIFSYYIKIRYEMRTEMLREMTRMQPMMGAMIPPPQGGPIIPNADIML
ncbi:hypothetical protein BDF20DRAFT_820759 [Mycotypha africana]|uniref:uncharacterized protein n=1 Tax=Mycotypha africana TaxID=64632 RepID=UPI0023001F6E|nr:uncharacterized protein BDF20DRAFT_820759 [Mycotypha africana]KAI8977617.1 hypothetical protein BDF20DRAFT_820759 [Mycotypha africana]